MKIRRIKSSTGDYNHWLRDKNLSIAEKGLMSTLINLPPTWELNKTYPCRTIALLGSDDEQTISKNLQELIRKGYIRTTTITNPYDENDTIATLIIVFENNEDSKGKTT